MFDHLLESRPFSGHFGKITKLSDWEIFHAKIQLFGKSE